MYSIYHGLLSDVATSAYQIYHNQSEYFSYKAKVSRQITSIKVLDKMVTDEIHNILVGKDVCS